MAELRVIDTGETRGKGLLRLVSSSKESCSSSGVSSSSASSPCIRWRLSSFCRAWSLWRVVRKEKMQYDVIAWEEIAKPITTPR